MDGSQGKLVARPNGLVRNIREEFTKQLDETQWMDPKVS